MKPIREVIACAFVLIALPMPALAAPPLSTHEVRAALMHSADWQLAHPRRIATTDWIIAPLYDGLLRTAFVTGDARYAEAVLRFGNQSGWSPRWRIYHADDQAVGHAWLDVYLLDKSHSERLDPMRKRLDQVLANPITEALDPREKPKTPGVATTDRWTWCDALYMAPPTLARLYRATGERKYLDFLDREYRATYDVLYDHAAHWFARDARYLDQKTPHGQKLFWSRGNGWVYGGLVLLLEQLPTDHPTRPFYEKLFREMTVSVLAAQQADGLWRPSLADPEQIALGEESGSAFFTFGLAWGVNHGLIDRKKSWPAVERGWRGLLTQVQPNGTVGYVQQVGEAPERFDKNSTQLYGTGAFLLAGSEILRALDGATKTAPEKILAQAQTQLDADRTPRAYARLVPERSDDLAWENDKVAFRIYGPALRGGEEDSGIDVWFKRVAWPVVDKWYRADRIDKVSYHEDHGEGYDGYKVGDTRGDGGLGLWRNGKLVTSGTYRHADIFWTAPEFAEFEVAYDYPPLDGRTIHEQRTVRLRLGEQLNDIRAQFDADGKPAAGLPLAVGLVTQYPKATMTFEAKRGWMSVWETYEGHGIGSGAVFAPGTARDMKRLPHDGRTMGHEHALALLDTDAQGEVHYLAGFAWTGRGQIDDSAAWNRYLQTLPGPATP